MSDEPKTITDRLAEALGLPPRPADFGRRCDHDRLARSCETCELAEAYERIAALEAAGDALHQDYLEALADPAITTCCDKGNHYDCALVQWREVRHA